jgi:hypothetical protein
MIIAYTGLAGSGKTYHMTQVALKLIERGEIVFSRHEIEGAYPIVSERELLRMHDCNVFFDEWHQDHSAKEWWDMDEVVKHIVTQSRKYSIIIHWSAQHWLYMDSFIRRNTDYCWQHEAMIRDPDTGNSRIGWHRARKIAGLEEELKHTRPQVLASKNIWIKKKIYEKYDSFKPIMLSKAKLSDDEINAIQDPYSRDRSHVSQQDTGKPRSAFVYVSGDVYGSSTAPTAPDPVVDGHSDLETKQDTFDRDEQPQSSEELIHWQELPHNADAGVKIADPVENGGGQRGGSGKQANNKASKRKKQA